ncbi:hypothetical protein [Motilimonas pumila]|uniref:hypothetical protein n=1 Tax=Motilimonas pumila TaxID=2303987 RepID=UPI001314294E|nr:hypothetical protein [Motilimonas pumila]
MPEIFKWNEKTLKKACLLPIAVLWLRLDIDNETMAMACFGGVITGSNGWQQSI